MKLSIITINYNNLQGLQRTIDSVMFQTWRDFEWIIIDGGSTDGSKDLIEKLAQNKSSQISYWCSESDKGIYNAMNKGIEHVKGEYVNFLNSGDWFSKNTILMDLFKKNPVADVLFGNMLYMYDVPQRRMQCLSLGKAELSGWDILYTSLPHQASFFKRRLFDNGIRYDEKFKVWGDLNMFFEMYYNHSASVEYYNDLDIACFDVNGISQRGSSIIAEEREKIRHIFLTEEELAFYYKSFDCINLNIRHNYDSLKWIVSFFFIIAKFLGYKTEPSSCLLQGQLKTEIYDKDVEFFRKTDTIRHSRLLWKFHNKTMNYIFHRYQKKRTLF